jgi:organic hydroperoxide reductase OsmC/OhrA
MADHHATILWARNGESFTDGRYSRGHAWQFDGGVTVRASSSPQVVSLPWSVAEAVDPEEAFVAALSSCHMLWFLSIAAKRGFVVESYRDEAAGIMAKNGDGKLAITRVTLRPDAQFSGERQPSKDDVTDLHREAHEQCFIASSVKTEICCKPIVPGWRVSDPVQ